MKKSKCGKFNNQMSRELNKHFGFPENYNGPIGGFENTVPVACKVFGCDSAEYKGQIKPTDEVNEGGL